MKKRICAVALLICTILFVFGCSKTGEESSFQITFIDVAHGDAALVECDGHFMLIDAGGSAEAGQAVCEVLDPKIQENPKFKLDYLVISHLHTDHYNGFPTVLAYLKRNGISKIKETWCNVTQARTDSDRNFISELNSYYKKWEGTYTYITVPDVRKKPYKLGSAEVYIISNRAIEPNDSLVILIEYGESSFLFTGDMERKQELEVMNSIDSVSLLKVAHHGSSTSTSLDFLQITNPDYAIISKKDSDLIDQTINNLIQSGTKKSNIYVTSDVGNIIVNAEKDGNIEIITEP